MSEKQKTMIQVRDNGSILVKGEVELLDAEGNVYETKPAFSLCRCGASSNKPFCDGTHKKIGFESKTRVHEKE
ncbi:MULTISPECIES: CDGSH iron-sulfur domain-containing protein [Sediminibacillus]|uniref:CDGSH iron-sulfur domain-containing protein n=1 Tax=Sediminibacillus TaxID=482460 RepID=UPI000478E82A|nr:CDGSH iron-sulfur domain-containing protein [Sediminibacillus terrae]